MQKWVLAEDVGIETVGDVFTPVLIKGTSIPCSAKQIFSTANDGQTAVTLKLVQGVGQAASRNRQLGMFDLTGIPTSPQGVPQIEVVFDIDDAGNLSVEARDLASSLKTDLRVESWPCTWNCRSARMGCSSCIAGTRMALLATGS